MNVGEFAERSGLAAPALPRGGEEISGVYIGDLLGNVMCRARPGELWITIMTNVNVIAVAMMTGVSAVIIAEGGSLSEKDISLAREKGVNILLSRRSAYETALMCAGILGAQV